MSMLNKSVAKLWLRVIFFLSANQRAQLKCLRNPANRLDAPQMGKNMVRLTHLT